MTRVFGNILDKNDLHASLKAAFEELDEILTDHAGPFATNCIIGSKWRQVNDVDEFTKDGIKILKNLVVSEEPHARLTTRLTRFVGIAVDKRCYDGTTTSMLLFCRLAVIALRKMSTSINNADRYVWAQQIVTLIDACMAQIECLKITEEDILERAEHFGIKTTIEDVRGAIAYHMAMISSKGDVDLSKKISTVIRSAPKKIHGMFRDNPLAVETDENYILRKQEYDILMNANIVNHQDLNYKNDTQWLSENAVIFASGNEINSGSWEANFLLSFISPNKKWRQDLVHEFGVEEGWEHYHEGKRHLVILSPLINDPDLFMVIDEFNKNNPNIRISCFQVHMHPRMKTNWNKTLHYMAGVHLFKDVMTDNALASMIGLEGPPVRAHHLGTTLALYNLYEKDGEVFHPLYREPDLFEPYTQFVKETEEMIEFANSNITNHALDENELTYLISLYRCLTCQEIYDIDIGGSIHDQYANRTVYEDAVGAALSAINDGVALSGYAHITKVLLEVCADLEEDKPLELTNEVPTTMWGKVWKYLTANMGISSELNEMVQMDDDATMTHLFAEALLSIVADSTREDKETIRELIVGELHNKWSYVVADPKIYSRSKGREKYVFVNTLDAQPLREFLACEDKTPVLLQAWSGYHEQFRRFRDILPKLANSTNLADMRIKDTDQVR